MWHYGGRVASELSSSTGEWKSLQLPFHSDRFLCSPRKFSASEYTIREITEKRHNYEMEKVRQVVVCTDYKMSSVGSNFCDPEFLPQYRFAEEEFKWEMLYSFFDRD
ncbi:MAG: hypothetical protein EGP68_11080 [Lachnospiraceae bacterium]|nr:hypothetical protein [Lachnospiraceae bacterium]